MICTANNQTPWNVLFSALARDLGIRPKNFQLVYPSTLWNWPTQPRGYIGTDQYDFCSTAPQWSAIGAYASCGDRLGQRYQEFLNTIGPVRGERVAVERLSLASNDYDAALSQARSAYAADPRVANNVPTFSTWLGSASGQSLQAQMIAKLHAMQQAQKSYNSMLAETTSPAGLFDAQMRCTNTDFHAKLSYPGLSGFPDVPDWTLGQNSQDWLTGVKAGHGPSGGSLGFGNTDQQFDFNDSWAGTSRSVEDWFWQVRLDGRWQPASPFFQGQPYQATLEFEALDVISIRPNGWYDGSFVRSMASGQHFRAGYSPYGSAGTRAVFRQNGFLGLLKTGMHVSFKPSFSIKTCLPVFSSFAAEFRAATGLRIGPFSFAADGSSHDAGWTADEQSNTFSGRSMSDEPCIFGITIAEMPPA